MAEDEEDEGDVVGGGPCDREAEQNDEKGLRRERERRRTCVCAQRD